MGPVAPLRGRVCVTISPSCLKNGIRKADLTSPYPLDLTESHTIEKYVIKNNILKPDQLFQKFSDR